MVVTCFHWLTDTTLPFRASCAIGVSSLWKLIYFLTLYTNSRNDFLLCLEVKSDTECDLNCQPSAANGPLWDNVRSPGRRRRSWQILSVAVPFSNEKVLKECWIFVWLVKGVFTHCVDFCFHIEHSKWSSSRIIRFETFAGKIPRGEKVVLMCLNN